MAKKQKMISKRLEAAAFSDSVPGFAKMAGFAIVADIVGALTSFHLACVSERSRNALSVLHSLHTQTSGLCVTGQMKLTHYLD
jgi:hypothetical protein